jgi:alkylhydroperoxidase family enzyme
MLWLLAPMLRLVQRDAQVGPGTAVRMRSSIDTEGDVSRVLGKLEQSGKDFNVVRYIANSPNSFRPFILFSDALLSKSVLPATIREIVILHAAVRHMNSYEWYEHERISQAAGVTADQLVAIRNNQFDSALFSEDERLGVEIANEMLDGGGVSSSHWEVAIAAWGVEGALDLVLSVGWWGGMVPLILEALGLEAPPSERQTIA